MKKFRFCGLPGVKRKYIYGPIVRSITAFMREIGSNRIVSSANDDGCINLWRDDEGNLRAAFSRYQTTLDSQVFQTKKDAEKWLKVWLPKTRAFRDHARHK